MWITPTFDAANFFGSESMIVTVCQANCQLYRYKILDNDTMLFSFKIAGFSISGEPSNKVCIKFPDGYVAVNGAPPIKCLIANQGHQQGNAGCNAGMNYLWVGRDDNVLWTPGSNASSFFGQIFLEIQAP